MRGTLPLLLATSTLIEEFQNKKSDAATWHHCFANVYNISAGLSPQDDTYRPLAASSPQAWGVFPFYLFSFFFVLCFSPPYFSPLNDFPFEFFRGFERFHMYFLSEICHSLVDEFHISFDTTCHTPFSWSPRWDGHKCVHPNNFLEGRWAHTFRGDFLVSVVFPRVPVQQMEHLGEVYGFMEVYGGP